MARVCKLHGDVCKWIYDIASRILTEILIIFFTELDHAIYVSRELVFQDNIGHLYNIIKKMKRGKEAIAMAPEQTKTYMQAFSGWQRLNPKTKLGRPPPGKQNSFKSNEVVYLKKNVLSQVKVLVWVITS